MLSLSTIRDIAIISRATQKRAGQPFASLRNLTLSSINFLWMSQPDMQ